MNMIDEVQCAKREKPFTFDTFITSMQGYTYTHRHTYTSRVARYTHTHTQRIYTLCIYYIYLISYLWAISRKTFYCSREYTAQCIAEYVCVLFMNTHTAQGSAIKVSQAMWWAYGLFEIARNTLHRRAYTKHK